MRNRLLRLFICFTFSSIVFASFGCNQQGTGKDQLKPKVEEELPVPEKEFTKTVGDVSFKMIRIEGVRKTKLGFNRDERIVSLSPYYIAETEVTQGLYKAVMGNNISFFNGSTDKTKPAEGEEQDLRPVESLTYFEALLFCNELTKKVFGDDKECVYTVTEEKKNDKGKIVEANVVIDIKKKGFRLPTLAEWEYAAKGGVPNAIYPGIGTFPEDVPGAAGQALPEYAWYNECSGGKTHQVAKKKPNGYGLYDMAGNVAEWTQDHAAGGPLPSNVELDPQGFKKPTGFHEARGCGWSYGGKAYCAVWSRNRLAWFAFEAYVGLRVACRL